MIRAGWLITTAFCLTAALVLEPAAHAQSAPASMSLVPYMTRIVHSLRMVRLSEKHLEEIRDPSPETESFLGYRMAAPSPERWEAERAAARADLAAVLEELEQALPLAMKAHHERAKDKGDNLLSWGLLGVALAQMNYAVLGGLGTIYATASPTANLGGALWGGALGSAMGAAFFAAKSYFMPVRPLIPRPVERQVQAIISGLMGAFMGGVVGSHLGIDLPGLEMAAQASLWGWALLFAGDLHYRWRMAGERQIFVENNVITALQSAGATASDLAWLRARLPQELSIIVHELEKTGCALSLRPPPLPADLRLLLRVDPEIGAEEVEGYTGTAESGSSRQP